MSFDVSVIVEWDNVRLSEKGRCVRMLQKLREQALQSNRSVEVIILFDENQVHRADIESATSLHLLQPNGTGKTLPCRIHPTNALNYYQLKNLGVSISKGEIVVFVDTDVIPEDNWFSALTEPFWEKPEIQVLAGHTYLDPEDLVSRAFAIGWFFPLRSESSALIKNVRHFYANNVAFRKTVFQAYPFDEMPKGMTRGACHFLSITLAESGVLVWGQMAAKTSHPAPNGWRHVVTRGFAQGRDWAMQQQIHGKPGWRIAFKAFRSMLSTHIRIIKNTLRHGRKVGMPIWQMPVVIVLMMFYYLAVCLGAWAHLLAPRITREVWQL
jgi:hypothetical protein